MHRHRVLLRAVALAVAFAAAAACGSDSNDESAATASSAAASSAPAGAAGSDDPASWGVKDKKLVGPSGFGIDLSKCPAKWDDKAGLTDTEIRLGQTIAQSGAAASYGGVALGMKAYFDNVNATEGGIGGRKINFTYKDDGYEAARGKANVDEMLETANLFAFTGVLGTPINLATYDKIDESCLPDISVGSAHPAFGDPVNHPWVVPVPANSYTTEGILWGQYVLDKYGKGATVAALVANNDFGLANKDAFEKFAKDNGLTVKFELHDPQAASVTNELTNLASSNSQVVILMTLANFCTMGFQYLSQSSWKPAERIVSQTCNTVTYFKPAGQAADGWVSISDRYDTADAQDQNVPFVKSARETIAKAGLDANNSLIGQGYGLYAWPVVDTLKRAALLPGGLTRTNVMLAARKVKSANPFSREGISYEMDGAKDAFPIEGGATVRYTLEAGKDVGTQVPFGKVIDLNGKTPNCAWDGKRCAAN
ncbi:MAG: ABC transporter substrate-binding protein [Acidimicrobiales bacterium]